MLTIFIGRVLLLSSLVILVLAGFWPHLTHRISSYLEESPLCPLPILCPKELQESYEDLSSARSHPKSKGVPLKKIMRNDDTIQRFGASDANAGLPRQSGMGVPPPSYPVSTDKRDFSSVILSAIGIVVATVMFYSVINLLSTKMGKDCAKNRSRGRNMPNKSRRTRVNRNERTRQLIMRHGGKSIATAIRYFSAELEKQKYSLFESSLDLSNPKLCDCACHTIETRRDKASNEVNQVAEDFVDAREWPSTD